MPVRVVHIITKLELGGAQKVALYTVENLDPARFDASLIAGKGGPLEAEAKTRVAFQTAEYLKRRISPWNEIRAYIELKKMLRQIKPHIVHTHSSKAGVLGRLAAHAAGVPVILHTIHGFGLDYTRNPLVRRILLAAERAAARRTTHFVAVSEQNIRDGERMGLFDQSKVSLIRAGVPLHAFRNANRHPEKLDALSIPRNVPLVGMVACFKPQKNPAAFIQVAAMVRQQVPDAHFLLIGDGELRGEIESAITEYGVSDCVHLAGWRDDMPELLKLLDVSVLTSRWEGMPCVIPESLSAGTPVVVTRAGGSAEAVQHGITGYVVEQGQWKEQASYIAELLRNTEKRRAMQKAGVDAVAEWDIDTMVRNTEQLYDRLLGACKGTHR